MKKILIALLGVILALSAVFAPIALLFFETASIEPQYTNTFYGALDEKYKRLTSIEEEKIVVVGGSSVAFGLDSALLEKYAKMPVVNFGLYADIGTKFMLDLSRSGINEGDIVILQPELDEQTMSLYFSADSALKACDDDFSMLDSLRTADDRFAVLGALWNFNREKLGYLKEGKLDPVGMYNSKNFNEHGDIDRNKIKRVNNILRTYYDKTKPVKLDSSIVSDDFIAYLNEYIDYCEQRGAKVYFAFCPVNDLSVTKDSNIKAFEKYIKDNVNCEIIGSLRSSVMDSHYFYDTNFHLNDAGVRLRTLSLIDELLIKWDDLETMVTEEPFDIPEYKYDAKYYGPEDENARFFTYEREVGYVITGLTEEGKKQQTLTLPLGYDGYCVTEINTDIFADSACRKLIIPENTNIGAMSGGFKDSANLTELWIYKFDESEIIPPSFDSKTQGIFVIYVPEGSGYTGGYYWGKAGGFMKEFKTEQ